MDNVVKEIVQIAKKYSINQVIHFGSRARLDNRDNSDYDIAIISSTLEEREKLNFEIEVDNMDTLCKIDLVFLPHLRGVDLLSENIRKDGVNVMDKFKHKFENYSKALERLGEAIQDYNEFNNLTMRDGAIQRFELTAELAWKTLKAYLEAEWIVELNSPKSVLKEAFTQRIIEDELGWLQVIKDRNATSHIYDEKVANEIYARISTVHIKLFKELQVKLDK